MKYHRLILPLSLLSSGFTRQASAQTLYAVNSFFGNTVSTYNATTGATINPSLIPGATAVTGLAIDNNGFLYVNDYGAGTVGKYNASTGAVINPALVSGFDNQVNFFIESLATNSNGQLFAASGSGVHVFDTTSGAVAGATIPPGGTNYVATDSSNNLYVANPVAISKYDSSGALIAPAYISGLSFLNDFAVDSNGSLFVAEGSNGTVAEFNADTGQLLNASFITGLGDAESVTTDDDGHIYVSTQSSIGEYDADTGAAINPDLVNQGAFLIRFSSLPASASSVPESPGTLALLSLGVLAVAATRRSGWAFKALS
jgi:sugar lactone lactonase YvrE